MARGAGRRPGAAYRLRGVRGRFTEIVAAATTTTTIGREPGRWLPMSAGDPVNRDRATGSFGNHSINSTCVAATRVQGRALVVRPCSQRVRVVLSSTRQ